MAISPMPAGATAPLVRLRHAVDVEAGTAHLTVVKKWTVERRTGMPTEEDPRDLFLMDLTRSEIIPYSEAQEKIFEDSKRITFVTRKYLGPLGYAMIAACGLCGGLSGVRVAQYSGVQSESAWNDMIPFLFGACAGVSTALLGMIFTGTLPVKQSDAANDEQDEFNDLELFQYMPSANRLIELFWSKKEAKQVKAKTLALAIEGNLPLIASRITAASTRPGRSEKMLRVLKTAIEYIKANGKVKVILDPLKTTIKNEAWHRGAKIPRHVMEADAREASAAMAGPLAAVTEPAATVLEADG